MMLLCPRCGCKVSHLYFEIDIEHPPGEAERKLPNRFEGMPVACLECFVVETRNRRPPVEIQPKGGVQ